MRAPLWPIALGAIAFGFLGPLATAPHDKKAGAPFAWDVPEGFSESHAEISMLDPTPKHEEGTLYRLTDAAGHSFVPRAQLTHSANETPVEETDLAQIAAGLPETFAKAGVDWVPRRHETRVRPDGARVGLIEGECTRRVSEGLPFLTKGVAADVHFRKLQLVFPDDAGTSIVTIDYGSDEATKWEPIFEATIARSKGVATRVPPAPAWMYGAWGAGGLVLGWLGASLLGSRAAANGKTAPAPKSKKDEQDAKRIHEEVDDDEEEEEEEAEKRA